jgi:hypothetical protein
MVNGVADSVRGGTAKMTSAGYRSLYVEILINVFLD